MARDYAGIDFPIIVPHWKIAWGFAEFKNSGLLGKLPDALQKKVVLAYDNATDLAITQADCDTIDDETWVELRDKLET